MIEYWKVPKDSFVQSKDSTNEEFYFRFKRKEILIVDSLGIYNLEQASPDYVILTHSPKINMNRLIERYPNCTIVADGSNYHSYVSRWKATCTKQKIPFHSTYEKGAFIID